MSETDFWNLSPIEFDRIAERHRDLAELEDFRSARLAHILANAYRDSDKYPNGFEFEEFLLLSRREKAASKQSPEQILLLLTAFNDVLGGTVSNS